MEIKNFKFSTDGRDQIKDVAMGQDWPVVYLLNNDKTLYIGETCNMYARIRQHLANEEKRDFVDVHVIFDDEFNKSAVLDIEQTLIRMCGAEKKFELRNANAGQSAKHNYYQRERYQNKIEGANGEKGIWDLLTDIGITNKSYSEIVNSDLFTYSPYTALTAEQEYVAYEVLNNIIDHLELKKKSGGATCVVKGSSGTGKTILAIYLMRILANINEGKIDPYNDDEEDEKDYKHEILHRLKKYVSTHKKLTIGYVLPMTSIRRTLKSVFTKTGNGLKGSMVIGPTSVADQKYDVLLVDETHRMPKGKGISWLGTFNATCKKLGMSPETANTLDWVMAQSSCRVLFYDSAQSIKAADISPSEFDESIAASDTVAEYTLKTQMRCQSGNTYIEYLDDVFGCALSRPEKMKDYSIMVFDDANKMIKKIKALNKKCGLCRTVAGYSWKWKTKGKKPADIKARDLYDISFDGKTYCWNMSNKEWILRGDSVNEIGCVHTVQGYDLNYVGVIFGQEIDYDDVNNEIVIYPKKFYDANVKKGTSYDDLKRYIVNAYKVMMGRGVKGCFMYACNPKLQEYLKKCFV